MTGIKASVCKHAVNTNYGKWYNWRRRKKEGARSEPEDEKQMTKKVKMINNLNILNKISMVLVLMMREMR